MYASTGIPSNNHPKLPVDKDKSSILLDTTSPKSKYSVSLVTTNKAYVASLGDTDVFFISVTFLE